MGGEEMDFPRESNQPSSMGDSEGIAPSFGVDIGLIAGDGPGDRYEEPSSSSMENIMSLEDALAFSDGVSASALFGTADPRRAFCEGDCVPSSPIEPGAKAPMSWNLDLNLMESIFTRLS